MSAKYWAKFRHDAFREVYKTLKPMLTDMEAILMDSVEYCEVAEAHQRFRDFSFDLERIMDRIKNTRYA